MQNINSENWALLKDELLLEVKQAGELKASDALECFQVLRVARIKALMLMHWNPYQSAMYNGHGLDKCWRKIKSMLALITADSRYVDIYRIKGDPMINMKDANIYMPEPGQVAQEMAVKLFSALSIKEERA